MQPPPSTPSSSTSQDFLYGEQTRKKKKRSNTKPQTEHERRAEKAYNIMKNSCKRDDCTTYGEHVGNELRKLSSKSQTYVKHLINNVLFKAALGAYENEEVTHGASILTPTTVSTLNTDTEVNNNNFSVEHNYASHMSIEGSVRKSDFVP